MDNFLVQSCASDNDNLTDFFRGLRQERRRHNELKANEHDFPDEPIVYSPILAWGGLDRRGRVG